MLRLGIGGGDWASAAAGPTRPSTTIAASTRAARQTTSRMRLSRHGYCSHRVTERRRLTSQKTQRFNVTISFGGTVRGKHASGTFTGLFRFFTLSGSYVGSCTTGTIDWSTHAP